MKWIALFGLRRRCLCLCAELPTSSTRLLNLCTLNAVRAASRSSSTLKFSVSSNSSPASLFSRRVGIATITAKTTSSFLSPQRQIARKTWSRNFATDKRPSKSMKDLKVGDLRGIVMLALPYKWRILAGLGFLFIGSGLFLTLPRILGKMIDEFDTSTKQQHRPKNKSHGEHSPSEECSREKTKTTQNSWSFFALPKSSPKEQKKREAENEEEQNEDFLGRVARYLRKNPLALGLVILFGAGAVAARIYLMHTTSQLIVNDLRTSVFRSILQQDMAFFDRNKVGEIVSRLSSDAYVVGSSISTNLGDGVRALFTSFGTAGMMVYTSPELSLLGAVIIPFIAGVFFVYGKWLGFYAIQMQEAIAGTNQLATERLSNVRTVRAFVAENKELNAYRLKISDIWDISRREGRATALVVGGFYFVGYGFITSLLYYGSFLIGQGLLTYGDLSSFMLYAVLCSTSVSNIRSFYSELMRGLGASSRLFDLRDTKPKIRLEGGTTVKDLKEAIRFESVAFAYPGRESIFNDVTFRIPAGSTTAIVGASGCGKSTIAHLLLGLYYPTQGRITVDGQDLRNLDSSDWRRMCGTVSQEPTLFSATIKENILYGVPEGREVTEDELYEAAQLSNCLDFIRSFPQGFDTMVGEHGASMLSGGQRQRIAIARALIKKPRILLLDEATSALDATSEYLVRNALDALLAKGGQTVLIIAHRLSTIQHAEQIAVLDRGSIAELGSFDKLMAIKDGIFQRLVEKQTLQEWRVDKF